MTRILPALLLCLTCLSVAAEAPRPAVQVETGTLLGTRADGVERFLGIPYAAPPVGARRWRAPAPAAAWNGERDATSAGAACPQSASAPGGIGAATQDEDCLFLNVWKPLDGTALPVMVWLHGGAHRFGAGSQAHYDGAALARRGVVVVTINYRLGYLGYFAHPALAAEAEGGNFGFLDQQAALRWVQHNIGAFGGDPRRVTIFGESAGAVAILALLADKSSDGLFSQAIVQSGGGWSRLPERTAMEQRTQAGLARIGIAADADAASLRAIPAAQLVAAMAADGSLGFGIFLDGASISRQPVDVFREGRQLPVPLLIGSNDWEGSLMLIAGLEQAGQQIANGTLARELYRKETQDESMRRQLLFGDVAFSAPARWVAAMQARRGSAWLYRFGYLRSALRGKVPGVAHGGEIPYVFDTLGRSGGAALSDMSATDLQMASDLADCWAAFARLGRPACGLGPWDAYSRQRGNAMDIGNAGAHQMKRLRAPILDAIDRHFAPDAQR